MKKSAIPVRRLDNTGFFKSFGKEFKKNKVLFFMLVPSIVYFILFSYLPMAGAVLAFKKFNYTDGIFFSPWVGFENFEFLILSGTLWNVTKNTFFYNIAFYITGTTMEITVAIILSEIIGKRFKKFTQSVIFLPYFVSFVLLAAFMYNIFNYEYGTLNSTLNALGMESVDVYSDVGIWKYILIFVNLWKNVGYGSVVYLAVISGFDPSLYEAAEIDGANKLQQIFKITIPLLKPTIIILSLMFVSRIMRGQFELFYNIIGENAQLYAATDVIDTFAFRSLTKQFNVGMGSAVSLYQSTFGLILIVLVNKIVKKFDSDSALF